MPTIRSVKTLARLRDNNQCQVHKHRDKAPVDLHHIWPQEFGGPTVIENLVVVCSNGHRLIHEYLNLLNTNGGRVSWLKRRLYGSKVRKLGELGYARLLRRSI